MLVLPMVYDLNSNITQLAERRETTGIVVSSVTNSVNTVLRRYAEHHTTNLGAEVCSIFLAVKDMLQNLILPPDLQTAIASPPISQSIPQAIQVNSVEMFIMTYMFNKTIHIQFRSHQPQHQHSSTRPRIPKPRENTTAQPCSAQLLSYQVRTLI